ncbi:carboxymuconolactone decarboxylase family protein [Dryocola sp. LX212]|jgi:alkylhydroperoxidase family enzyme
MLKIMLSVLMIFSFYTDAYAQKNISQRDYNDVTFKVTRLGSNSTDYLKLPKEWAKDYGSDSTKLKYIDSKLAELVRLRVSQIDKCNYCVILHTKQTIKLAIPMAKVDSLSTWRQSDLFSSKEKAALNYAETLAELNYDNIQLAFDKLISTGFSQPEIEELTNTTLLMNIWSRIFMAQGKISTPPGQ